MHLLQIREEEARGRVKQTQRKWGGKQQNRQSNIIQFWELQWKRNHQPSKIQRPRTHSRTQAGHSLRCPKRANLRNRKEHLLIPHFLKISPCMNWQLVFYNSTCRLKKSRATWEKWSSNRASIPTTSSSTGKAWIYVPSFSCRTWRHLAAKIEGDRHLVSGTASSQAGLKGG